MDTADVKQCDDLKAYELDPKCNCVCHIGASVCRPIERPPQPQQSEATFEAWEHRYFPPNGQSDKGQDIDRVDLQNCWRAAVRSQKVAPEIIVAIAARIEAEHFNRVRRFGGRTFGTVALMRFITEAIAQQPGKAGE